MAHPKEQGNSRLPITIEFRSTLTIDLVCISNSVEKELVDIITSGVNTCTEQHTRVIEHERPKALKLFKNKLSDIAAKRTIIPPSDDNVCKKQKNKPFFDSDSSTQSPKVDHPKNQVRVEESGGAECVTDYSVGDNNVIDLLECDSPAIVPHGPAKARGSSSTSLFSGPPKRGRITKPSRSII